MDAALPARAAPGRLEVAAVRVRVPFRRPFATAAGTFDARDAWIVRLRDRSGAAGYGEAGLAPEADDAAREALARAVRALASDAWHDDDLDPWFSAGRADDADDDAITLAVRAAVQGAALDLGLTEPGTAEAATIAVNATIASEDDAACVAAARAAVANGFRCLKLKVGAERTTAELVARIGAIREAIGDAVALRLDANGAWDAATALERATGVAALGIEYLEQPIPPGTPTGGPAELAKLRHASPVGIAADEAVTSLRAARALLAADAIDVLVVKPAQVGGAADALAIAEAALAAGVGVTISTLLETGVGIAAAARVAAALPDRGRAHGLATAELLVDDLLATPLRVADGRLEVPRPGLALDGTAIDRWAVERVGAPW